MIFKLISRREIMTITWEVAIMWRPQDLTEDKTLTTSCCCEAPSHYLNQCWPRYCQRCCQNLSMIEKESMPDRPKFCQSGSAVRHLFWRLLNDWLHQYIHIKSQDIISYLCPNLSSVSKYMCLEIRAWMSSHSHIKSDSKLLTSLWVPGTHPRAMILIGLKALRMGPIIDVFIHWKF